MPHRPMDANASAPAEPYTLTRIRVQGFKSLADVSVDIRPLTVFAGANSSGKSSVMQPLLLIKQTIEASYRMDGVLKLDGPLVYLDSAADVAPYGKGETEFGVEVQSSLHRSTHVFKPTEEGRLGLVRVVVGDSRDVFEYLKGEEAVLPTSIRSHPEPPLGLTGRIMFSGLDVAFSGEHPRPIGPDVSYAWLLREPVPALQAAQQLIYLPGLRGMPQRSYPPTKREGPFAGSFSPYTASVIEGWQRNDLPRLRQLQVAVRRIGLTKTVEAVTKGASEVEIKVGRLPANTRGKDTLVNIADVGLGMSQVLPILVALIAAEPGQLVYIEQPELHLHPKAQRAMASVLADAAKRGVRVVIETHSAILLLAIQTLVAEGALSPDLVALHWFSRDSKGFTKVKRAELDENGAFGPDWPEDFSDTELATQDAYLSAVERRETSESS